MQLSQPRQSLRLISNSCLMRTSPLKPHEIIAVRTFQSGIIRLLYHLIEQFGISSAILLSALTGYKYAKGGDLKKGINKKMALALQPSYLPWHAANLCREHLLRRQAENAGQTTVLGRPRFQEERNRVTVHFRGRMGLQTGRGQSPAFSLNQLSTSSLLYLSTSAMLSAPCTEPGKLVNITRLTSIPLSFRVSSMPLASSPDCMFSMMKETF